VLFPFLIAPLFFSLPKNSEVNHVERVKALKLKFFFFFAPWCQLTDRNRTVSFFKFITTVHPVKIVLYMSKQPASVHDLALLSNNPIVLCLGQNKLVLQENGKWQAESSDLDAATFEIEKLVEEKETLAVSLNQCLDQIESLQKEVVEINNIKSVVLEMVS
jgi:hypothetical protein